MDLIECYRQAWKGFSTFWLPLCAVALILVVANAAPEYLARGEVDTTSLRSEILAVTKAKTDYERRRRLQKVSDKVTKATRVFLRYSLLLSPVVLPIAVLLIVFGMKAGSKEGLSVKADTRQAGRRGLSVLLTQALGMVILCVPGVFFLALGVGAVIVSAPETTGQRVLMILLMFSASGMGFLWACVIYVVFFFAPQLAADEDLGPFAALRRSATLVNLSKIQVCALVLINVGLQMVSLISIIGLIPATAFANTARGVAYYQLLATDRKRQKVSEA